MVRDQDMRHPPARFRIENYAFWAASARSAPKFIAGPARALLILTESVGDSRIGRILIQHVSWNGGQLGWRELILLICVSGLWRQFCAACRAGQWRCVSMSAS